MVPTGVPEGPTVNVVDDRLIPVKAMPPGALPCNAMLMTLDVAMASGPHATLDSRFLRYIFDIPLEEPKPSAEIARGATHRSPTEDQDQYGQHHGPMPET